MNKNDIINALHGANENLTKKDITTIVDGVFEAIQGAVASDGEVSIYGFGKFKRKLQKGRTGTVQFGDNKGSTYQTKDKFVPTFTAAKQFCETVK
ncbi:MAG: HU family DNA-binding protein [Oscillospiraceae bacterium]